MEEVQRQVSNCTVKQSMLVDAVAGTAEKINENQQRIETIENLKNRRTVILSGFEGSEKKKACALQLQTFFKQQMKVDITIEEFYRIGTNDILRTSLLLYCLLPTSVPYSRILTLSRTWLIDTGRNMYLETI